MPEEQSSASDGSQFSPDPYADDSWDASFLDALEAAVTSLDHRPSASPGAAPATASASSTRREPLDKDVLAAPIEVEPAVASPAVAYGPRPPIRHVEIELAGDEVTAQPVKGLGDHPPVHQAVDDMVVDVDKSDETTSTPPRSLFQLFRSRRGYFSVTDLCAPVWCEVQYDYGLRGKRFLPVAERPKTFLSARGHVIEPDIEQAMVNAKIMDAGSVIHQRLEKEIHPVEVQVDVTTSEERWALRLLNMLAAVEALLELGICREMPVMGFIQGHFVVGIVDEIQRRPVAGPPVKASPAMISSPAEPQSANASSSVVNPSVGSPKSTSRRTPARSSPRETAASATPVASKTTPITNFFRPVDEGPIILDENDNEADALLDSTFDPLPEAPASTPGGNVVHESRNRAAIPNSSSSPDVPPVSQAGKSTTKPTHALFVSDSKTRRSYSLPRDDAALSGRLQCQLYKLLLDGLLAPICAPSTLSSHLPTELATSTLSLVFAHFDLDPDVPFSDGFCAQAQALIDGNSIKVDRSDGKALTLHSLACCWDASVDRLGIDRRKGVEDELQLVYRYQSPITKPTGSGQGKTKRKSRRGKDLAVPPSSAQSEEDRQLQLATQASLADDLGSGAATSRVVASPRTVDGSDSDQLQLARQMSLAAVDSGPAATSPPAKPQPSNLVSPQSNVGSYLTSRPSQPGTTRAVQAESSIEQIDDGPIELPEGSFDAPGAAAAPASLASASSVAIVESMLAGPSQPAAPLVKKERIAELMRLKLVELRVIARKVGLPEWGPKNVLADRIFKGRAERVKDEQATSGSAQSLAPLEKRLTKRSRVATAAGSSDAVASLPTAAKASAPPADPLRSLADDDIIGVKTFRYEAVELETHINHVLAFWLGEREPIGVGLDATWKCNSCELRESCEWRAEEADRIWQARVQARVGVPSDA